QFFVAKEFKTRPVKLLSSAFGDHVNLTSTAASGFGCEQTALNLKLSYRIDTRIGLDSYIRTPVSYIGTIHCVSVLCASGAVHRNVHRVGLARGIGRADVNLIRKVI